MDVPACSISQTQHMNITNRLNLPAPLVAAVTNDPYHGGGADYSVTTLIKPAQAVALERKHRDELTEDVADRIWSLIGQIGHTILERAAMKELVEHRFFFRFIGKLISGQADIWNAEELLDYKFTSAWAVKDGLKPEWECQLNLLILLAGEEGISVKEAKIIAILRDWSKLEARRSADYPLEQVVVLHCPIWSREKTLAYLTDRLTQHIAAAEGNPPPCNDNERWAKPAKFAVMKPGRKTALKLFGNYGEAQAMADGIKGAVVQTRPAVNTRCDAYCAASEWCPQYKALQEASRAQQPTPEGEGGDGELAL